MNGYIIVCIPGFSYPLVFQSGLFAYFAMDEVNGNVVTGSGLDLTLNGDANIDSAGKKDSALYIQEGPGYAAGRCFYSVKCYYTRLEK